MAQLEALPLPGEWCLASQLGDLEHGCQIDGGGGAVGAAGKKAKENSSCSSNGVLGTTDNVRIRKVPGGKPGTGVRPAARVGTRKPRGAWNPVELTPG